MVELSSILILGILAQWLAWRLKVPAILPLILIGLLVGPISTLWRGEGNKLIEPIYNGSRGFFPDELLFYFVSLAIGIILFEGGLTLKRREIAGVGPVIVKLLTVGSLLTFVGAGLAAHLLLGLSLAISFLFSALIIVTGPTVIAPILQNIPLTKNIATVLKWEGILIDPLGALAAVLVYEFIRSGEGNIAFTSHAFVTFFQVLLIGLALGTIAALALNWLIKKEQIPHYLLNVFTLATVLGVFVLSETLSHESGLLTVVVMGLVLGNLEVPQLKEIMTFKESLSVMLISLLFILLAANIDMSDLYWLSTNPNTFIMFAIVVLVLRPLGVFLSTIGSELNFREKLFISWVGPRGIVAAGIASLFGITLERQGVPGAEFITPLVFLMVLGTVVLNAGTASIVARVLGVTLQESDGILIIGANKAARLIGQFLTGEGRQVVLIDNNNSYVDQARKLGLDAYSVNVFSDELDEKFELLEMGYLIAMTSSTEVNEYAMRKYHRIFGENGAFRVLAPDELRNKETELPATGIFSYLGDYLDISELARDYPHIYTLPVTSTQEIRSFQDRFRQHRDTLPIFIKTGDGKLSNLPADLEDVTVEEGAELVILGKEQDRSASTAPA